MRDLNVLRRVISEIKSKVELGTPVTQVDKENYIIIIEALDRQIPKNITYEGFCPNCKTQYPMYPPTLNKYCSNCGQKLEWDNL